MSLEVGSPFPEHISFTYVPYTPEASDVAVCGIAIPFNASEQFKHHKVVVTGVPGAFTATCTEKHIPPYVERAEELAAAGVDYVVVIAFNDAHVMSAWGKALGARDSFVRFMSDEGLPFASKVDLAQENGIRMKRFAMIVDHGTVAYLEVDSVKGVVEASSVETVLTKLQG